MVVVENDLAVLPSKSDVSVDRRSITKMNCLTKKRSVFAWGVRRRKFLWGRLSNLFKSAITPALRNFLRTFRRSLSGRFDDLDTKNEGQTSFFVD